jgi:hypothetical protein
MTLAGTCPAPVPFGGMGTPVNRDGYSGHFPVTMTVTEPIEAVTGLGAISRPALTALRLVAKVAQWHRPSRDRSTWPW